MNVRSTAGAAWFVAISLSYVTGAAFAVARSRPRAEPPAGAVALSSAPPQTVELTLPFDGIWGVVQGIDSGDTHTGYAAFALDFVPAEKIAGALPEAKRRRLSDFPCYGQPVRAPADGQVVWARDAGPDHPPHNHVKRDPGNFVILQHAPAEYTEFRHLQAHSVIVNVGDRVSRGQPVGRCGNSGNAGTPHLHVGLLGAIDPIATRPMRFSRYQVLQPDGTWKTGTGVPSAGQILRRQPLASSPR
jgi:hypothetical protein